MTIEEVALAAVPGLISTGDIIDAKSIIGLTLTALRRGGGGGLQEWASLG
jgi:hypothetical protein